MLVPLKVTIDVNARWFRSAVACAGVPGRTDEARDELRVMIARQVSEALNSWPDKGAWDRVRVESARLPRRRVLRANKVKGAN